MRKPQPRTYYDVWDLTGYLKANGLKEGPFNQFLVDMEPRNGSILNVDFADSLWDDGADYSNEPKYRVPAVRSMEPDLKAALEFLQKEFGNSICIKYWW